MIFSSLPFLFFYLMAVLAVYKLTPLKLRNLVLLLVSLFFYGWGEPVYILIMLLSIVVDYVHGMLVERWRGVADDGARDELGKQGHVGAEGNGIFLHRRVLAVDVDGVAHGLEGVKADADGQGQAQRRQGEPRQGVDVPGDKIPVLEEDQDRQIEEHRGRHRPPCLPVVRPPALHQHAVDVVHHEPSTP